VMLEHIADGGKVASSTAGQLRGRRQLFEIVAHSQGEMIPGLCQLSRRHAAQGLEYFHPAPVRQPLLSLLKYTLPGVFSSSPRPTTSAKPTQIYFAWCIFIQPLRQPLLSLLKYTLPGVFSSSPSDNLCLAYSNLLCLVQLTCRGL
jgi:hypothetical protein